VSKTRRQQGGGPGSRAPGAGRHRQDRRIADWRAYPARPVQRRSCRANRIHQLVALEV